MKKGRHTEEQIIGVLKQVEAGRTAKEVARELGVSEATIYTWKSKYGGMEVSEARRLKELGTIRHFFRHCLDNEWILRNWAEKVPMPKNVKPADREPYNPQEVARIIAACDQMGRGAYERLRARAMILVLRYTGLRISDVATLEKARIREGQIFLRDGKKTASL